MNSSAESTFIRANAPRVVWALLLVAAPLLAVSTWQVNYTKTDMRHYSIPIIMIELMIIACCLYGGRSWRKGARSISELTKIATACWLIVATVATLNADTRPDAAAILHLTSLILLTFAFIMWVQLSTEWVQWQRPFLMAVAIGAAIYSLIILALSLSQASNPDFNWLNFGPGVSNVRQLGFYGLSLSGIAFGFLACFSTKRSTVIFAFLAFVGIWLTIMSGGRAGFFAALIAIGSITLFVEAETRLRFLGVAVLITLTAIAASYAFVPHEAWGFDRILNRTVLIDDKDLGAYSSRRIEMWRETFAAFQNKPLFGHGEGQFRYAVPSARNVNNHPHNAVLQFLYQWGVLGLIALIGMLWTTVKSSLVRPIARDSIMLACIGVLAAYAAMSLLEGPFYHSYPLMVSALCVVIISSRTSSERAAASSKATPQGKSVLS